MDPFTAETIGLPGLVAVCIFGSKQYRTAGHALVVWLNLLSRSFKCPFLVISVMKSLIFRWKICVRSKVDRGIC